MVDAHFALAERDLDGIPHEPMRHAVADRVDVHERIIGDAAAQLLARRYGARRQRAQCMALVALFYCRRWGQFY